MFLENLTAQQISRITEFEKWVPDKPNRQTLKRLLCMLTEDGQFYHKYCGFNKFSVETFPVPQDWQTLEETIREDYDEREGTPDEAFQKGLDRFHKWVTKRVCDPTAKMFVPSKDLSRHNNLKLYKTLDNYDIGYFVYVDELNNLVHVYGRTTDIIIDDIEDHLIFTNLIKTLKYLEIFIGTSPFNKMTNFSGGHGKKFDGNSILLRIGENKYASIGIELFEFTTDEPIVKYVSSVGNNCVPYPYAESVNWCYDIIDHKKTPVSDHNDRETRGYVSFVDGAKYLALDNFVLISNRDIDHLRTEADSNENTGLVRYSEPMTGTNMKNTCADESLLAVQQLQPCN